ncbi:enoyl-CoA hydratase-related protein [Palleronia caenipelagi]|uniref:2-(1,2-epoxy-1,2-dihydrophenyl)acetyl-CoA isomerase n=1 Tax=Palleronia caenipelagi TaxID=2489174 RepID=A0A547Q9F5_9RHOB|nr:enoyl-CoA hydratase-related protein [Palleronia caenipelagi]TRD22981.1 2-(1,2-epoxy-1,2-dihydrophenyl)acetyl-CoA isomerase [Palleronia caenipelagi]
MDYKAIELSLTDGVAVITLNRPESKNALNTQMRSEITHALKAMAKQARCIVLTGAGGCFCSGQDLTDAESFGALDLESTLRDEYEPMLHALVNSPVPTIAAVHGPAAGAGANLALGADVVIASESSVFLQAFTRIGLIPDAGGTYWLPRQMGLAKAMGAALFAEPLTAKQASDWGMIWEAVPDDAFDAHWRKRAQTLASGPTTAYAGVKRALREGYENNLAQQLELEAEIQGEMGRTRDFREGVLAFLQKRPANYEGR